MQFKRGAFCCLPDIQPFLLSYDSPISHDMIAVSPMMTFYLSCCGPPSQIYHEKLPVFRPNDFLWENHTKEGEDKV
jgi:hypothetical protein